MKDCSLIFICLLSAFFCFSQEKKIEFYGIVTDEANIPISDVLISVNWGRKGLLSHSDGSFYITATRQDTLVFKHVSFEPRAIALKSLSDTLKIQLTQRTNILDEVEITNWGDWQDFKGKIANMNADSIRNTPEYRLEMMFGAKKRHPIKNPYFRAQEDLSINPITIIRGIFTGTLPRMLYNKYCRNQKQRRLIEKEKLQELAIQKNAYRYSEKILGKMLNISGEELKSFKIYCDYSLDFSQNDYELTQQIRKLYENWKVRFEEDEALD